MDLRELLSVVWKRRLVVILVVVFTVGCGIAYWHTRPPTYESTVAVALMPLIIGASLVVGLGVAILFALGLERFRARVETIADLGEITPLPLLGQLPKSRDLSRAGPRIVWDQPGWVDIQESLRSLRTNL